MSGVISRATTGTSGFKDTASDWAIADAPKSDKPLKRAGSTAGRSVPVTLAVEVQEEMMGMLTSIRLELAAVKRIVLQLGIAKDSANESSAASISSLGVPHLVVKKPIPVVISGKDDDYVASFFDANISAGGDTPQEAFGNLREILVAKIDLFNSLPPEKIGREPTKQFATIREFVAIGQA